MQRSALLQAAVLATGIATQDSDYGQVAAIGAGAGAALINSKYGRDDERESDIYGMNYMSRAGYNPNGAVELQQTFVELKDNKQPDFLRGLFASHPPSQERLVANRAHANTLPAGGVGNRWDHAQKACVAAERALRERIGARDGVRLRHARTYQELETARLHKMAECLKEFVRTERDHLDAKVRILYPSRSELYTSAHPLI